MPTLDWLTRDEDLKRAGAVAYRLLEADPALSRGDPGSGNMLIQGDNLDALKSLLPYYAGQVKCIYIDPPFGTGRDFENYDDNIQHALWLGMMYPRLQNRLTNQTKSVNKLSRIELGGFDEFAFETGKAGVETGVEGSAEGSEARG